MIEFNNGLIAPEQQSLNLSDIASCMLVESAPGRRFMKITDIRGQRYLIHEVNNIDFDLIKIRIENREAK